MLKKIIGIYMVAVAALVGAHTVLEPLYHVSTEARPYSPLWDILNAMMIVALVLGIAYSYLRKSSVDNDENGLHAGVSSPPTRCSTGSCSSASCSSGTGSTS